MPIGVRGLKACYLEICKARGSRRGTAELNTNAYHRYVRKNRVYFTKGESSSKIATTRMRQVYNKYPEIRERYIKRAEKDRKILCDMQKRAENYRVNAYSLFVKENYAKEAGLHGTLKGKNLTRVCWASLGAHWKAMQAAERKKYAKRAFKLHSQAKSYLDSLRKSK